MYLAYPTVLFSCVLTLVILFLILSSNKDLFQRLLIFDPDFNIDLSGGILEGITRGASLINAFSTEIP